MSESRLSAQGGPPGGGGLSEQAFEHVRRGILTGELPVGSVVSHGEIATELGMSKTRCARNRKKPGKTAPSDRG
jgi:DNA-binding GntR family transcriptional regulator